MNFELIFATNYNGIHCCPKDLEKETPEIFGPLDEIADTLPGVTYEWCSDLGPWDDIQLTNEQEQKLCDMAKEILLKSGVFGDDINVVFRYDDLSS